MRIVGGKYRGRNLVAFDGDKIRPTSDKVRESVFNILQFGLSGADFLDLFSGSGAMGIEALSRGVNSVTFNDFSRDSLALLKKNLAKVKVEDDFEVVNSDAVNFVKNTKETFDIIFLDPPYAMDIAKNAWESIVKRGLLNDGGIIVYERDVPFNNEVDGLEKYDERRYGKAYLTFFRKV